ncbi:MAG: TIGR03943 family protein [Cyanothece sp. SIO1E1]|nr:TIGR03943 family protein [Cyanothece sp. SIO1E1]
MQAKSNRSSQSSRKRRRFLLWGHWLDVLAVIAWGVMLLQYWFTGKLNLLLHPDYMWLANVAGIALLTLGGIKGRQLFKARRNQILQAQLSELPRHFTLFPAGLGSGLLLGTAIFGLLFTPRPFASQTALARGVTDTLVRTRSQPQQFRVNARSEDRSVVDWVRTLNVYPEPDAYTGQKVNVQGFVIHPPGLPESHLLISRFVITCCAADVYPIGLPVKLAVNRSTYPPDTWLQVAGEMITETLDNQRQLVIEASSIEEISEPKNPYEY